MKPVRALIGTTVVLVLLLGWYEIKETLNKAPITSPVEKKLYIVNTPGCKILDIDPHDEIFSDIKRLNKIECDPVPPLTYIDMDGPTIKVNYTVLEKYYSHQDFKHCVYQQILRTAQSDYEYSYGAHVKFINETLVHDEFLRVSCMDQRGMRMYTNFHTAVQKMKFDTRYTDDQYDVIMIGVDSISRLNFIRQFPKTRNFLTSQGAVEFGGYTKVGDNTFVNIAPMLAGKYVEELPWDVRQPLDDLYFVWKNFSLNGYVTMLAEDAPDIAIFNYDKPGFHQQPTDHYMRPFSLALEEHGAIWNKNHDCVGSSLETDVVLHYVTQFIQRYHGKLPLWAFAFITRLTHDNIDKASLADDSYYEFFRDLYSQGKLQKSFLVFFSDHGMRFGKFRESLYGKLEERLPFLYISVPDSFKVNHPDLLSNLRKNAHRLSTPFDIHKTLTSILHNNHADNHLSHRSMNLFREIPVLRTCDDAEIGAHWCSCFAQELVPPTLPIVLEAAQYIISEINSYLKTYNGKCAELTFLEVTDARKTSAKKSQFLIAVRTLPGEALFEASVVSEPKRFKLSGGISRINRFGNQSHCVKNHEHKKFCFCV